MPSGKFHAQDSLLVAGLVVANTFVSKGDMGIALALAGGSVTGLFLSPDLDQDGRTNSEWLLIKHLPFIGHIFFMYWYPYAVAIKHRSPLSHAPLLGTLGRLLYCLPVWLAVWWVFAQVGDGIQTDVLIPRLWWVKWAVIGLALSDTFHWARDTF